VICIVANIPRNTARLHVVQAATQDTDIKQGVLYCQTVIGRKCNFIYAH